jgi:hypothetical protein
MGKLIVRLLLIMLVTAGSAAFAEPPSDASIRELFEQTHVQSVLVTLRSTMAKSMQTGFNSALANKNITDEQQKILDRYMARMQGIFDEELRWEKIEPIYLQVYRESFTQDEVDAMNAFYHTPAGRAVIEKVPATLVRVTQLMQPNMQVMLLKMQALQADITKELKATQSSPSPSSPPQPQVPSQPQSD